MGKRAHQEDFEDSVRKKPRNRIIIYSSDEESNDSSMAIQEPVAGPSHGHTVSPTRAQPETTRNSTADVAVELISGNGDISSPVDITEADLDEDLLLLLGEAPEPESTLGKAVHKDVASRWVDVIKKGLSKDMREKLEKEYLIPSNCELLVPPILNPETKAALTEVFVNRDTSLMYRQKQISNAIAMLAQAVDVVISHKGDQELKQKILKPVNDACRILCDMHHRETKIRRKFVISSINTGMKETLVNSGTDKYLFGDNMSEKLKAAKTVQKSGETLKVPQKSVFNKSNFHYKNKNRPNFKPLHQKTAGKQDAGKMMPAPRHQSGSSNSYNRAPDRVPKRLPSPPLPRRNTRR